MKYFDIDFMLGNISEDEIKSRIEKYNEQMKNIIKNSSYNIRLLISDISLHDAKIQDYKVKDNALVILIAGGDNQSGHFLLTLHFETNKNSNINCMKLPFNIVYYEYDFKDDYILSLLSDDERELEIRFNRVSIGLDDE